MGHSLAQVFAQGGHPVRITDVNGSTLAKAKALIAANLRTLAELGLLEEKEVPGILERIQTTARLGEASQNADLVIEAVFEDVEVKKDLFRNLDQLCPPRTILASNTSYLDIFKFVETHRPQKVLITHWFAPPHIVPLVEIVRGPETSQETADAVKTLLTRLGKKPIVISKFLPGFIANRLQSALRLEVLYLLDNGYATAEDIDEATKASFGLRMPLLGLVKRMDYTGLELTQKVVRNRQYQPPPVSDRSETLDRLIVQGRLGIKNGKGFYDYGGRSPEELMR